MLTGFILRTDCSGRKCAASFYPVVAVVSHNVYSKMNDASSNLHFMLKNVSKKQCTIMTQIFHVLQFRASDFSKLSLFLPTPRCSSHSYSTPIYMHCPGSVLCDRNNVEIKYYSEHTEHHNKSILDHTGTIYEPQVTVTKTTDVSSSSNNKYNHETGENAQCFMNCIPHQILFGWWIQAECDGHGMWHVG